MLIFDGLHYDALAMSPFEGALEEFYQTIFPAKDPSNGFVERQVARLIKNQQRYPDNANFTLRCGVCRMGIVGQQIYYSPITAQILRPMRDYCFYK